MQTQLRYWEYYGMTDTFDRLFEGSSNGEVFNRLYNIITSRENILLAYRTVKSNRGSKTAGTDGRTIDDYKNFSDEDLINFIRKRLSNYQPMKVKRVYIPKDNGELRPLGIPTMSDRIIQQAFKQVLEPICEAKFHKHSYGFRPLRSTHHAIARVNRLINLSSMHYVVDVDIKGFFDNVNHSLLLKQLWNMGIQDKIVLKIISKMLKAEIDKVGKPTKGTPQGGILSPLLANVVLNDLDHWISGQWEEFETRKKYHRCSRYDSLRLTNLKEGFIVRYADDFKILCKDHRTAQKWFIAVKLYLKDRLKLDISPNKSKVVNLRKSTSEFLGFTFKAIPKRNKHISYTKINDKKIKGYAREGKKRIKRIQKSPTAENVLLYNSWVAGIHNYNRAATNVNLDFKKIGHSINKTLMTRLKKCSKYHYPRKAPPSYTKFYKTTYKTYRIGRLYLYPIMDIKHKSMMNFSQSHTPFSHEGRKYIYEKIKGNVLQEIHSLMKTNIGYGTVEYYDNRISRYSMKKGKCEITGLFLQSEFVHCHHAIPLEQGGTDEFKNLVIMHKFAHILIHAVEMETINKYKALLKIDNEALKKINKYRKLCNLESI